MRSSLALGVLIGLAWWSAAGQVRAEGQSVPVLYSTDLLHPHDDPDDHYDLACLFALREFDVRGIVLDLGERQAERSGEPAVRQMRQHHRPQCADRDGSRPPAAQSDGRRRTTSRRSFRPVWS